jgi:hypothetical protein
LGVKSSQQTSSANIEGPSALDTEGKALVRERKLIQVEKARRVLQAATVEAFGRPGAYVTRDLVMQRANMADTEHFITIAKYLEERGWIGEADADYGDFVVTASGIDEATG